MSGLVVIQQNTTLSKQFQNKISKSQKDAKPTSLKHKHTTDHVPVFVQALH